MSVATHTKNILACYRDDMSGAESLDFLKVVFGESWDFDDERRPEDFDEEGVYQAPLEYEDPDDVPSEYLIIKGGVDHNRFKSWFSPPSEIKIKGNVMFALKYRVDSLLVMAETEANGWFSFSSTTNIAKMILKVLERTNAIKAFLQQ